VSYTKGKSKSHSVSQLLLCRKFCRQKLVIYSYSLHNELNVTEGFHRAYVKGLSRLNIQSLDSNFNACIMILFGAIELSWSTCKYERFLQSEFHDTHTHTKIRDRSVECRNASPHVFSLIHRGRNGHKRHKVTGRF